MPPRTDVIGRASFGSDALAEQAVSDRRPAAAAQPEKLVARREAAAARDGLDADRWSDDGGSVTGEAA